MYFIYSLWWMGKIERHINTLGPYSTKVPCPIVHNLGWETCTIISVRNANLALLTSMFISCTGGNPFPFTDLKSNARFWDTFVLSEVKPARASPETMKWMCETRSRPGLDLSWTHDPLNGSPERYLRTRANNQNMLLSPRMILGLRPANERRR